MKDIQIKTRTILVAYFLMVMAGCNDFLDKEPLGELTASQFFETEAHAEQSVNAIYQWMRQWPVHVFSYIGVTDIISDDAYKGSSPNDANFLIEIDNFNYDPGNIAFSTVWEGYYQGIYRANLAIKNIPGIDMDEELKARLVGEARFLRAYFYFFLVRGFGGVPAITKPLNPGEFIQPRATSQEIYNLIIQDLQYAAQVLPVKSEYAASMIGRATRGAALGYLSKVYLYQEDYENALAYADSVIESNEYYLNPDYAEIFRVSGENGPGSIFEIQAAAFEEGGGGTQFNQVQGVRGPSNKGWGFNNPSDELLNAYEPGDPRIDATVLFVGEQVYTGFVALDNPDVENERYNQKAYVPEHPGGQDNGPGNIRRLRYADVLLIYAEAANELGMTTEALDKLNMVRERARNSQSATIGYFGMSVIDQAAQLQALGIANRDQVVYFHHVQENSPLQEAGITSIEGDTSTFRQVDVLLNINGQAITTTEQARQILRNTQPGENISMEVLSVSREANGNLNSSFKGIGIQAQANLKDITTTDYNELREAIWKERRVELAMEQHRFFDLLRQDRASNELRDQGFEDGKHELWPVPQRDIDITGGALQQNPGYVD